MRVRVCAVAYMIGCSVLCSTLMGRVNFYLMRLMMFFDEFDSDPSLQSHQSAPIRRFLFV